MFRTLGTAPLAAPARGSCAGPLRSVRGRPRPGPGCRRSWGPWPRSRSSSHSRLVFGGRLGRRLLLRLACQVRVDLTLPGLDGLAGVDLELEPLCGLLVDVGDVHVELVVPAAQLVDRAVLLAEQRILDLG